MSVERLGRAPQVSNPPELPMTGDILQARYQVRGELGRGGMAVVLAAVDQLLGREVALKVMLPTVSASSEAVERFVNEARSLATLRSPHVVRVLDVGRLSEPAVCAGLPFMVLELLRGEDLHSVAVREGVLSPERVVRYALQACAGLSAAHAQGIVHRDLKPENLFLAVDADGAECLKVLDFGIARSHSRRAMTGARVGLGSPGYMSPEQVGGGGPVDARTDIWSLGVVMYELLGHQPAFAGEDPQELCAQTLLARVVPLAEIRSDLPPALIEIVERCMEREPARRYATVDDLALALNNAQASEMPAVQLVESDIVELKPATRRAAGGSGRRAAAWLLAGLILAPSILLLPKVARAPELAPARAWSAHAAERVQSTWQNARARAHALWMKEPAGPPAAGEP